MPVEGYNVLAPNFMGTTLGNSGIEGLTANYGYGVAEATRTNEDAAEGQKKSAGGPVVDNLRTQKAREFGLTKKTVGF
jgi:hypothetical protein